MTVLRMHHMAREAYSLTDFIQEEMNTRKMSLREFAAMVGVAHSTISRLIDERDPIAPTLDLLVKLSKATGKSLEALIVLAYPDVAAATQLSPSSAIMAQRFEELPDNLKETIMAIIRGWQK